MAQRHPLIKSGFLSHWKQNRGKQVNAHVMPRTEYGFETAPLPNHTCRR